MTHQVTLTVLMLAAFALAMVVGFGIYATAQADHVSLERQKIFFANGLKDQIAAVVREQESVTVWDDSVINTKAGNQSWIEENLSVWMYSYYGHNRVYILDAANRPVHVMREGKVLDPSRLWRGRARHPAHHRKAARDDRAAAEGRRGPARRSSWPPRT